MLQTMLRFCWPQISGCAEDRVHQKERTLALVKNNNGDINCTGGVQDDIDVGLKLDHGRIWIWFTIWVMEKRRSQTEIPVMSYRNPQFMLIDRCVVSSRWLPTLNKSTIGSDERWRTENIRISGPKNHLKCQSYFSKVIEMGFEG